MWTATGLYRMYTCQVYYEDVSLAISTATCCLHEIYDVILKTLSQTFENDNTKRLYIALWTRRNIYSLENIQRDSPVYDSYSLIANDKKARYQVHEANDSCALIMNVEYMLESTGACESALFFENMYITHWLYTATFWFQTYRILRFS